MYRVERHIISKSHKLFKQLDEYCFKSKNLYNQANYLVRQEFINNGKWLRYHDLYNQLKDTECYKDMQLAHPAQQVLMLLDKNWKSFFQANKAYKKNPAKFSGRPKLPSYKNIENGRNIVIFTNFYCKRKDTYVQFPKIFNKYKLTSRLNGELQQVRIVPRDKHYVIEVVYDISSAAPKPNNGKYLGVDLGVDNCVAMMSNTGLKPVLIDGKGLKSINHYSNVLVSHYSKVLERMNKNKKSNRLNKIRNKRNNKINYHLHHISKYVVDYCLNNDINTVIIGKNDNWKQNCNMGKENNQNFVQIPHARLINQIQYKAEEVGISVILINESYTSGTSFLDDELPIVEFYNKTRRVTRGLFKTNNGTLVNADINGALQILNKANISNVSADVKFDQAVKALVVKPVKVNAMMHRLTKEIL